MAAVTPAEAKTIEGQRLAALFAAIGALPAAALVASSPEGAPLFAAAISAVAAAYMFWMFTDDTYEASIIVHPGDPEWDQVYGFGTFCQWSCFGYGAAAIACTMLGFAGVHSQLRSPLSVEAGFIVALGTALAIAAHVGVCLHLRNGLVPIVSGAKKRKDAQAAAQKDMATKPTDVPKA